MRISNSLIPPRDFTLFPSLLSLLIQYVEALVLEEKDRLSLRDFPVPSEMGPNDVRVKIHTVGICGSDVHYYTHGKIGPFVVKEPMILGHEASGTVIETGENVTNFKVGDRVCMEPGIPNVHSKAYKLGIYNVDPAVTFWATPPIHGCLTAEVVHPANFTYKLPDEVSYAEGAMVEPLAIGVQAASRAKIKPGDIAAVTGAGPIGMVVSLAALASGCSRVFISDLQQPKLDVIAKYPGVEAVNIKEHNFAEYIASKTDSWGADVVFESSGAAPAIRGLPSLVCPGGAVVLIGMPVEPVPFDIVGMQAKEVRIETVFRYANIYDRTINLLASGKVDVKPLISATLPFAESIAAFNRAVEGRPDDVKLQIRVDQSS